MRSEPVWPTTPSTSRGPRPASASAPMPALNVMLRESWPSSTRACSVLKTPTMATSWRGCAATAPSAEDEVAEELELLRIPACDHERGDRAVAPGLEPLLDAR